MTTMSRYRVRILTDAFEPDGAADSHKGDGHSDVEDVGMDRGTLHEIADLGLITAGENAGIFVKIVQPAVLEGFRRADGDIPKPVMLVEGEFEFVVEAGEGRHGTRVFRTPS